VKAPKDTSAHFAQAFELGKRARREGKSLDDNPFHIRGEPRRKWYEGWCEANAIQHAAQHGSGA
jgi:ribosome modulation factor